MRLYNKILTLLACGCVVAACGDEELPPCSGDGDGATRMAVRLSGAPETKLSQDVGTRADFPNSNRIGVVAAYYNGGAVNWMSYDDINNAAATAGGLVAGVYPFTWDVQRYWPLDNSELVFLAYSPHSSDSPGVTLRADRTTLDISLQQDMPDVLYASGNENPQPYKKSPLQVVDLGTFKHVFSQVTIKVVPDDDNQTPNPVVNLTSLKLETTKKNATFDLLAGDGGLVLWADADFTYDIFSGTYDFSSAPYESTVMVYPGTQDFTTVSVTLQDGSSPLPIEKEFVINPDFENVTLPNEPIVFERAKNTELIIKVSRKTIQNPEENITLQGMLTDWVVKDDFGIIVN